MSEVLDIIREAGIVGCGGAGFPTHVKLAGDIKRLIINGIECEPLLRTDRHIMRMHAKKLVIAANRLQAELGIERCTFATKRSYGEEVRELTLAIKTIGVNTDLFLSDSYYPAGDEQNLVYEVTGRALPPGSIPLSAGCAVLNTATLLAVYDALDKGKAFHEKYLTVSGEVRTPCVLHVPLGTSFAQCIDMAGGTTVSGCIIVSGGPLMGAGFDYETGLRQSVQKTTSGILVLKRKSDAADIKSMRVRSGAACIQCSFCTELCPRHLLGHPLEPHRIMRKFMYSGSKELDLDDPVIRSAALCSECGVCEIYACPMGLMPRRLNAMIKAGLREKGIRLSKSEVSPVVHELRASRRVPSKRIAARAGVLPYYGREAADLTGDIKEDP
ncbi:MAG: Electron transport complex protein RnfC [Firmicutes bacterium ADurb.Bin182]|nr:MAG: Electron transport complex protein RnfC [Firmicutes bacterium ADurb.Bin182]